MGPMGNAPVIHRVFTAVSDAGTGLASTEHGSGGRKYLGYQYWNDGGGGSIDAVSIKMQVKLDVNADWVDVSDSAMTGVGGGLFIVPLPMPTARARLYLSSLTVTSPATVGAVLAFYD